VIEIGKHLSETKERVGHGRFLPWIEREFEWSQRTAYNFIQAFEAFGSNLQCVADLDLPLRSFYKLAAPSTPEAARAEVLERAGAGERLPSIRVPLRRNESRLARRYY
jgi:Protein of unknown function (DUF3102)